MDIYFYIAFCIVVTQVLFTIQVLCNVHYAIKKHDVPRTSYRPRAVIIVPCKGIDTKFEKNIRSFFSHDYSPYQLWFVVEDAGDPAAAVIQEIIDRCGGQSKAEQIRLCVAGRAAQCSQKLHNILFCYRQIPADIEALVFADSDACADNDWLSHIVYPLRRPVVGAASGYRWFVPMTANLPTLAMSSMNAIIGQLLGNTRFNQAWGGSMAIRMETFRSLNLESIWSKSVCDDLTLTTAVRRAGKKMIYVPACMVASYASTQWGALFEFARRQFIITRHYAPRMWWLGLLSMLLNTVGFWATLAAAVWATGSAQPAAGWYWLFPAVIFLLQAVRAGLRQWMISQLLKKTMTYLRPAVWADLALFWLWSPLLLGLVLSSAVGSTIVWRGIRYNVRRPFDIAILPEKE